MPFGFVNSYRQNRFLQPQPDDQEEDDTGLSLISQRESPFLEGLIQHLKSIPRREDYEPSFGRKLLSGLMGSMASVASRDVGTGLGVARHFTDQKYNEAMESYLQKQKQLEAGAKYEGLGLTRDISLADKIARDRDRKLRRDEMHQTNQWMEENRQRDDERARERLNEQVTADKKRQEDRDAEEAGRESRFERHERGVQRRFEETQGNVKQSDEKYAGRKALDNLVRRRPKYSVFVDEHGDIKPIEEINDLIKKKPQLKVLYQNLLDQLDFEKKRAMGKKPSAVQGVGGKLKEEDNSLLGQIKRRIWGADDEEREQYPDDEDIELAPDNREYGRPR